MKLQLSCSLDHLRWAFNAFALASLAACGGGGGSDDAAVLRPTEN
jgi:hypothetical protein